MINYGLLIAVLAAMFFTRLRTASGSAVAIFIFAIFLMLSPDTGEDYSYYKEGYEGITFSEAFPFVLGVDSLTVDQGFLWWMGLFRLFFDAYNIFLSLNFIFLMYLLHYALTTHFMFKRSDVEDFLYLSFPVIIPVAFYWSPRSAPSFIIMIMLVATLHSRRFFYSMALAFCAAIFHSQYIPNVLGLVIFYIFIGKNPRKNFLVAFGASFAVALPLIYSDLALAFTSLLDGSLKLIFLVAVDKLHYFVDGSGDGYFRYSFLLILILEILVMFFLLKDAGRVVHGKVTYLLSFCVAFSLVINLLFWNSAHLAGRVARFSDWILATVGVLYLVKKIKSRKLSGIAVNFTGILSVLIYFSGVYQIRI